MEQEDKGAVEGMSSTYLCIYGFFQNMYVVRAYTTYCTYRDATLLYVPGVALQETGQGLEQCRLWVDLIGRLVEWSIRLIRWSDRGDRGDRGGWSDYR